MLAGVPDATGPLALAELVTTATKATVIKRDLRIVADPTECRATLSRARRKAQEGAVAKLIQRMDNSRASGPRPLPASRGFTYHKVQFGKVAFAVPRQP